MPTILHVILSRIHGFLRRADLDREFDEELAAHLAMAEEEKIRRGMTPHEARREARIELGGLAQLRDAGREARGLPWLDPLWLDIKLGLRMLRKSWGLTLVGGLAMTLAVVVGVCVFVFLDLAYGGTLPLDEGDRVVALWTQGERDQSRRGVSWQDFERWRDSLRSMEDLGAFRTIERNLAVGPGFGTLATEPVLVAEITASGFDLARVAPLLGRTLTAEDELPGSDPVVVIGFDPWQMHFAADPQVLGEEIRLGASRYTVVGVMPKGFAFPINHRFWIPLREDRREPLPPPPEAAVFARLETGVSLEKARSELSSLGLLPVSGARESQDPLGGRVESFAFALTADGDRGQALWLVRLILVLVTLLVVPPCANIAILVYARTISRQREFAARHALGASRSRVVGQLFVEMLVLATLAATLALLIVGLGLRWAESQVVRSSAGAPFWMDFSLSFRSVLFAAGLAVVAATIAGLVPALQATGRQMQSGLRTLGGHTATKLGPTWTLLVVFQVAISLAVLPAAVEIGWGTVRKGILGPGFAAERYLTARLAMDSENASRSNLDDLGLSSRFGTLQEELARQLRNEPGVLGVTLAELPGDEPWKKVEIERNPNRDPAVRDDRLPARPLVRANSVDAEFFEVFGMQRLTGRGFRAEDFDLGRTAVIVNRTFVEQNMGSANPLGHRLRYVPLSAEENPERFEIERWHEIVGMVEDRPSNATHGTIYHPREPGLASSASLALHVGTDPASRAERLRQLSRHLDPSLRVSEVKTLDEIYRDKAKGNNAGALSLAAVTSSVLLLSAAGMYALLAFTINKRRREIGIRAALGAQPQRLLTSIFQRVFLQLAAGMIVGISVALLLDYLLPAEEIGGWTVPGVLPATTVFMMLVGLLAAVGPARRGLQVDPIEELRNS